MSENWENYQNIEIRIQKTKELNWKQGRQKEQQRGSWMYKEQKCKNYKYKNLWWTTTDTIEHLKEKTIQHINTTYIDVKNEKKKKSDSRMSKIRKLWVKNKKGIELRHQNKYGINVKQGEKKSGEM